MWHFCESDSSLSLEFKVVKFKQAGIFKYKGPRTALFQNFATSHKISLADVWYFIHASQQIKVIIR